MQKFMIFLITGWTGFYIMALELLGGRILFPYFGGTVDIWGGLICIFLLALSLGHLTGGTLSKMTPNIRMMGFFLFAAAASTIIIYAEADYVLDWVFKRIFSQGYAAMVASLFLFTLPSYVLGMVTPYALRLLAESGNAANRLHSHNNHNLNHLNGLNSTGASAGWLYFTGAIGSAIGTVLTSFYLVLWMQLPHILLMLMIVSVVLGLLTFFVAKDEDGY